MISIIICTYNRDKYIFNTLKSIAENDLHCDKYEIVLINNNSTDNTEFECFLFQKKFPEVNFRYFIENNQGISYARNRGVTESVNKIMCFIDDDETVKPNYFKVISNFFDNHPDAVLCGGRVEPVFESKKPTWLSHFTLQPITGYYNKGNKIKIILGKDYPGTGHASLKRELFDKYGFFNTDLGRKGSCLLGSEDKDLFLRIIEAGEKCYYLPEAVVYHHIPQKKLTKDFFNRLTYSIGRSEKLRTQNISKTKYFKRLFSELIKWAASIVLFVGYTLILQPQKGTMLLLFRWNVTKGLL
jgi:glycosyltransferase involved in cell wall biosynthesis